MDDQNKNLLLATGLSFAVMLAWFAISPPQTAPAPIDETTSATPVADIPVSNGISTGTTSGYAEAVAQAARITIETPRLEGSLSLLAGRIDDLRLKDYTDTIEEGSPIVTLLSPEGSPNAYYGLNGWAAASGVDPADVPGPRTLWSSKQSKLTPNNSVTLTWDNGKGLTFNREIAIDENYMFKIAQSVTNNSSAAASLAPYGLLRRHGEPSYLKNFFILHEGMVRMSDGELEETKYSKIEDYDVDDREGTQAERIDVTANGWVGYTDHFWMTTLIPDQTQPFRSVSKYFASRNLFQVEAVMPIKTVEAGATATVTTRLFAGAKEWEAIRNYEEAENVTGFLDSIDWGWFYFFTKPLFAITHTEWLHWKHGLVDHLPNACDQGASFATCL